MKEISLQDSANNFAKRKETNLILTDSKSAKNIQKYKRNKCTSKCSMLQINQGNEIHEIPEEILMNAWSI